MAYDTKQVISVYNTLTDKIKSDLDEQFNLGRIKGSDYANVYAQLMGEALKLAFQAPMNESQVNKTNNEINLLYAQKLLTQAQTEKTYSDKTISETQSNKDIEVKNSQIRLYNRQTQGFNDKIGLDLIKIQLNAWSMMFSSGLLTDKPSIISSDAVSILYNEVASRV